MNFWPFKKKPVLTFEKTEATIKKEEQEKLTAEQEATNKFERRERNSKLIKELSVKLIAEAVEEYKARVPQPFKDGELVSPNKYSFPFTLGWLGTASHFINEFKKYDDRINWGMVMPVSKIWVDTSWLSEMLDPHYGRNKFIYEMLDKDNIEDFEGIMSFEIVRARKTKGEVVEWAIDFQWNALRFKYTDNQEFLDLKWNGFPATTFLSINHPLVDVQKNLMLLEKEMEDVKDKLVSMQEIYDEMIKRHYKSK